MTISITIWLVMTLFLKRILHKNNPPNIPNPPSGCFITLHFNLCLYVAVKFSDAMAFIFIISF